MSNFQFVKMYLVPQRPSPVVRYYPRYVSRLGCMVARVGYSQLDLSLGQLRPSMLFIYFLHNTFHNVSHNEGDIPVCVYCVCKVSPAQSSLM